MLEAEEFEKKMLRDVLDLVLYRETVYDVASNVNGVALDEYQTRDLLDRYGNIRNHYTNASINDLYNDLISQSDK